MATIRQLHFCSIEVNSPASVSIMILVLEALKEFWNSSCKKCQNHKNRLDTNTKHPFILHLQVACPGGISNTCAAKPPKMARMARRKWWFSCWNLLIPNWRIPQAFRNSLKCSPVSRNSGSHSMGTWRVFTWWTGCKILKIWFRWNKCCETSSNLAVLASWYQLPTWHT